MIILHSIGGDIVNITHKDIKKRHLGYIVACILFTIMGLVFALYTNIFPEPLYEDLLEKTIIIEDVHITSSNHNNIFVSKEETDYSFTIKTNANEKYHFSTLYPEGKKLETKLQKGTVADIKYSQNAHLPIYYIHELSVKDEVLYPYEYTADTNKTEGLKIAFFAWFFAIISLCYYFYIVNKDIKKQKNKEMFAKKVKKKKRKR